jgi:hypothetical protein
MPTQSEISLSPISAKGDIISTDGSSRTRVAVGTNGQILTARSSSTSGIQYATPSVGSSSFVLISSTTVTAAVTSVSISMSADTNVALYYVTGSWRCTRTSESESGIYPNDYTSSWNYYNIYHYGTASPLTMSVARGRDQQTGGLPIVYPAYSSSTYYDSDSFNAFEYYVTNGVAAATSQTTLKTLMLGVYGGGYTGTTTGTLYGRTTAMICSSNATQPALSSLVMRDGNPAFSNIAIGSIFRVYAIKKA